jgi:acetyl-CoA C-acetyltransferase
VVGVAQIKQRPEDPAEAVEAVALMTDAVRNAAEDAGAAGLLEKLDLIGVVDGAWKYSNPAALIAQSVGATGARTSLSANGGNTPQSYVNNISARIQAGELDVAVVTGAEIIWSRRRQRRAGQTGQTTVQEGVEPDEQFGVDVPMSTEFEQARGMNMPINYYPVFESAIRAARGETLDEHRDRVSNLWEGFNRVAVDNEYAWFRNPMTAEEIRNPSPTNRMVGFPYTKAMNSNWDLDQAAAVLLCSAGVAEAAGISRDRWVFPWAGTDAHDTYSVSERRDLHSSPAITAAGKELFTLAGVGPDDIGHIDIYSCFPSAVQVSAEALGLGQDRQLTQTGGLTFAGGPLNNYVTHSIATMISTLRDDAGSVGLVTANGGYLTKHALGIYSTTPPATPYRASDVQDEVDKTPKTPVDEGHVGAATIEAYTVMHNAEGPEVGLCALRTSDGARTWGRVTDTDALGAMLETEAISRTVDLGADGTARLN